MRFKVLISTVVLLIISSSLFGVEGRPKMRRACLNRIDSTLDLLWNAPTDNCGTFTHFNVYGRDNSLSLYEFLGSYTNFTTNNINIKLKNLKSWEFYLVYHKACNGTDSIYSDTISIDNEAPFDSQIDSVSVDLSTQKTIIGWSENPSTDTKAYYVYFITGTNSIISTTDGISFLDNAGPRDPTIAPIRYGIAAIDSCENASLISDPHVTIHLQNVYNQCNKTISLQWTPYVGWEVDSYDIYLKINAGNYSKIGSVISNINQFTYNFSNFGDVYCFYVRAKKLGSSITSSSNITCANTNSIIDAKNSYIAKASVQRENIELTLAIELGTSVEKINIFKAEGNGAFAFWQSINTNGGIIELVDNNVSVQRYSYRYFFNTEGPCNLVFDSSQIAKTILLNVIMLEPGDQTLTWSLYDDFIKGSSVQQILLSDDPNFDKSSPWNIITTTPNNIITLKDASNFGIDQQQICYCVRAIENVPNVTYTRQDSSYSNIQCVTADPIIYFPNAIQINGFNTVFYPKGVFIDYQKSSFIIYDRWGQIVYETNDIRKGWDGSNNGEFVQSDVYAYKATIVGLNGKILYFDGTLTVLK